MSLGWPQADRYTEKVVDEKGKLARKDKQFMSTHMDGLMGDMRLGIRAYITPNEPAVAQTPAVAETIAENDEPGL